jgi:L-iditol 2-dehydrogenase
MKAILATEGDAVLAEVPIPEISDGEILLALEACGLCGTDVMKLDTRAKKSVLGHELVGRVVRTGRGVSFREGDRLVVSHHVPCLSCHWCSKGQESMCRQFKATNIEPGGFAEFIRIPALHVRHTSFLVSSTFDAVAASQTEPLACVLRNVKRLNTSPEDVIGIVGLGAIGQMTGQLLSSRGVKVMGLDLMPDRVEQFSRWGRAFSEAPAFAQAGHAASIGRGFDAVIFSAGTPELVANSVAWLRDGGTLNIFASFHPNPFLALDLNQIYHRELSVTSSYSPCLTELREAFDLITSRRFDPLLLNPNSFSLSSFNDAVTAVKSRRSLKSIILPG